MANSKSWKKIFKDYNIDRHDFDTAPFPISAKQIKHACQDFEETGQKEVRILCKQDTRESRPDIFKEKGLFILPVRNGQYQIIKGEGYVDIPQISTASKKYKSKMPFTLETSKIGDSEMQHLDYAYATSLLRIFMEYDLLVLTERVRKFSPQFVFHVNGHNGHEIDTKCVQTEIDAGYEGANQVVLVEAKNIKDDNVIIRQLYYPYRQWQAHTDKRVVALFFGKASELGHCMLWQFKFTDINDYNSIKLERAEKFEIEN